MIPIPILEVAARVTAWFWLVALVVLVAIRIRRVWILILREPPE